MHALTREIQGPDHSRLARLQGRRKEAVEDARASLLHFQDQAGKSAERRGEARGDDHPDRTGRRDIAHHQEASGRRQMKRAESPNGEPGPSIAFTVLRSECEPYLRFIVSGWEQFLS